jgi:hypothetical protein
VIGDISTGTTSFSFPTGVVVVGARIAASASVAGTVRAVIQIGTTYTLTIESNVPTTGSGYPEQPIFPIDNVPAGTTLTTTNTKTGTITAAALILYYSG